MHNRKSRTYPLAICAMLSAIILLLAFTPLGLIDLPLIKATILHVPVIIGAVLLDQARIRAASRIRKS